MKRKILTIITIMILLINPVYAREEVKLSKCVDGDTFKIMLKDKEYTIRMLAIDTPESVHPKKPVEYFGKEASEYTCNKLTNASKIELEFDKNSDKFDKYDRMLAWVYVDDLLLQEELVANGYAKVAYLYGDYKYVPTLKIKQELASAKNIGIWDTEAANKFTGEKPKEDKYTIIDVIVVFLLLLIIVFVGDKTIKRKAKKKLKKYLD